MVDTTEYRTFKKGEYLVRVGEVMNDICFMNKGILRGFFIDANGKEVTDCFAFQCGVPAMTFGRLEENVPSPMNIEMLTDGSFFCIPISTVTELQKSYIDITLLYNRILISALDVHWKMQQILHQYSAPQRYQWFLKEYPGLIGQIRNKYVASFLGMTPITLSRLRRTFREEGNN